MSASFLYGIGSGLIFVWGIAHLFPTKGVVDGMGELTRDGRRIAVGTWVSEGWTLIFIGVQMGILVLLFGGDSYTVLWVARLSSILLVVMAAVTALTVARTDIVPMKICPFVKLATAGLFFAGTLLF